MTYPVQIESDDACGQLRIEWDDGTVQRLTHRQLRVACHCAHCRSQVQHGTALEVPVNIRLASVNPVGNYGVQLVFDDGHDKGIYPWAYLQQIN